MNKNSLQSITPRSTELISITKCCVSTLEMLSSRVKVLGFTQEFHKRECQESQKLLSIWMQFRSIWLNLIREYSHVQFRIHLVTSINSRIKHKHYWQAIHNIASTMSGRCFRFSLHTFLFPSFWYRLVLV